MNKLKVSAYSIEGTSWEILKDATEDFWYLENVKHAKISTVNGEITELPSYIDPDYLHLFRFKTPEEAFKVWDTKLKDD